MKLSHLMANMFRGLANVCLTKANAVIGATTSAFTTGNAVTYAFEGALRSLATQTNTALSALAASDLASSLSGWLQPAGSTGFYVQPANTTVYYVIGVTSAGTVKVVQGTYAGQSLMLNGVAGLSVVGDGSIPDIPDGFVPITVMKVASGGATFTPGTTALTGIATFIDVMMLPLADRP